jgi:hypothetical protein
MFAVLAVAGAAGCGDETIDTTARVRVTLLLPEGSDTLGGIATLDFIFATDPEERFSETIPADATGPFVFQFAFERPQTVVPVRVEGKDVSGVMRARGFSVPVPITPGRTESVSVLMLSPGIFAEAPAGMSLRAARALHGSEPVGDRWLLVAGGTTASGVAQAMEMFDLATWAPVPRVPDLPNLRSAFAMVPLDPLAIAMVGGVVPATQVDLFLASDRAWTSVAMPAGAPGVWRSPRFASMEDGTAIVAGGYDGSGAAVPAVLHLGDGFARVLSAVLERDGQTVTPVLTPDGMRAFVYGGQAFGEPVASLIDPESGEEEVLFGGPPEARTRHTAIRVTPSRVLILGGVDNTGALATHGIVFNADCLPGGLPAGCAAPWSVVWSDLGPMLRDRAFVDAVGVGLDVAGESDRLLVACGGDLADVPMRNAFVVNVRTGTLAPRPLQTPRSGCSVERLPNGNFAVVGGLDASGEMVPSIEVLDPGDA